MSEAGGDAMEVHPDFADRRGDAGDALPGGMCAGIPRRLDALSIRSVADRGQAPARYRNALDRRCAGLAVLDGAERAGATQRETGLAIGEGGCMLARHHLSDLARLEVCDFHLTANHVDGGIPCIDGDAELRALHHGCEVGSLDLEMLDVALFNVEQDRAGLLLDRRRESFVLL